MVIENFFDNLNELMAREGIKTPNELARKSGIAQSTINSWTLRKTNIPSAEHIEKLATFFKVEPHYFLMRPGTQNTPNKMDDWSDFSTFLNDLAQNYLSDDAREDWKKHGNPNEFIRLLRANYESGNVALSVWFTEMQNAVAMYVNYDSLKEYIKRQAQHKEELILKKKASNS